MTDYERGYEQGKADAMKAQEPVAWRYRGNLHEFDPSDWAEGPVTPLYKAPPQRQWVGLTDEEVQYIADSEYEEAFVRLVEAKLKVKNWLNNVGIED
jgi:hypothetical protein